MPLGASTTGPCPLHSRMRPTSLAWVSPRYRAGIRSRALNNTRRNVCFSSPFLDSKFNIEQHEREWAAGKQREQCAKAMSYLKTHDESNNFSIPAPAFPPPQPPIRKALDGKIALFATNNSTVLLLPTIFCPQWRCGKENIAPWPSRAEMKYEGEDRISTDDLHRRFPGAPRVEGNATVNWQHRAIIPQFPFDDFIYPIPTEVDIWMRGHWVRDLEFTDEEGREAIGEGLMGLLDPMDQFLG